MNDTLRRHAMSTNSFERALPKPAVKKIITTIPVDIIDTIDKIAMEHSMTRSDLVRLGLRAVIRLEEKGELI